MKKLTVNFNDEMLNLLEEADFVRINIHDGYSEVAKEFTSKMIGIYLHIRQMENIGIDNIIAGSFKDAS